MRFKLFGVLVELPFLSVAIMTMVLLLDSSGKIFFCFLAAFVHECGHVIAMLCYKIKPDFIKLRLFDVVIFARTNKIFCSDLVITLSGPVLNLIFAVLFCNASTVFALSNLVLGLFNLLPVMTFDGGHALALLLSKKLSYKTTNTVIKLLTFIVLIPVFTLGVLVLTYSKYNYSLLLIALYLLAILFLK